MRTAIGLLVTATSLLFVAASARSETPLLPEDVLRSAADHFPSVVEAEAKRDAREGERLSALGGFDTQLESNGFDRISGYYNGRTVSGGVSRRFRDFGSEVYSSYSISNGSFPIYEDKYFTNEAQLGYILHAEVFGRNRRGIHPAKGDFRRAPPFRA